MKRILLTALCLFWGIGLSCYLDPQIQCDDQAGIRCRPTFVCESNKCVCPKDSSKCGTSIDAKCVNLKTDKQNCGVCGKLCAGTSSCLDGACSTCEAPNTDCSGSCVDLQTSEDHCGSCQNACPTGLVCTSGKCECNPGQDVCSGACVDLQTSKDHCGKCDNQCPQGKDCIKGVCDECKISDTIKQCGEVCADTTSNAQHCGACDKKCASGEACCTSACADLQTSTDHCGACGNKCASGQPCKNGQCACADGKTSCSGKCVDTSTDGENCGQCGNKCANGQKCTGSICCALTEEKCGGACADVQKDTNNCGKCGTVCAAGEACIKGSCGPCTANTDCATGLTCESGKCTCGKTCVWNKTAGVSGGTTQGNAVAVDSAQNSYVIGTFSKDFKFEGQDVKTNGIEDIFVARFDPAGNLVWIKVFGGTERDLGNHIALSSDGKHLAIAGQFSSSSLKLDAVTLTNRGKRDLLVAKLEAATGTVVWAKNATAASDNDDARAVGFDSKGNLIATGQFTAELDLGNNAKVSKAGVSALYVAAWDSSGTPQWLHSTEVDSHGNGLAIDKNDDVYVTGKLQDDFTLDGNTITSTQDDLFAVKYEPANKKFAWAYAAQGGSEGNAIAVNDSGEAFITGTYTSTLFAQGQGKQSNGFAVFVLKLDATGKFAWVETGKDQDQKAKASQAGTSILLYDNGKIAISGYFSNEIELKNKLTSQGDKDIFAAGLEDTGSARTWLWDATAGATKDQSAHGLSIDANGSFFLTGSFADGVTFGAPPARQAKGTADFFLWKITP